LLAQAVADRTKQAVVYENHGCKSPGSHGLSFYFPEGNYKQEYDDITFPTQTGWGDFLKTWIPITGGPTDYFYRVYFYPLDNDSDEWNDTVMIKFKALTDREEENATIRVEMINETDAIVAGKSMGLTLHLEEANYSIVYLTLPTDSLLGKYRITISLFDSDGNRDELKTSSHFYLHPYNTTIPPPELKIEVEDEMLVNEYEAANLTVKVTSGIPEFFEWDFEGDGVPDWNSTIEGNVSHTYFQPGTYPARVRVLDQWGQEANATVLVRVNALPIIEAEEAIRANPGIVHFNLSAHDPDGNISLYEWDIDGDGIFEGNSTEPSDLDFTFPEPGDFTVTLRVRDNDEAMVTKSLSVHINHPPIILGEIRVISQGSDLILSLSALDPDGEIVAYLWDLDGDGIPERESRENHTTASFPQGGHLVKVRVKDDMGLIAEAERLVVVESLTELEIGLLTNDGIPINGPHY
ncbi:MAG: PKD domain-containing protein, partial [Thermoplasmata archaeon]|nr:PKD domain-containing protein [Thermoplasmata archaeon]